ncbi:SDR family NAD(P)-dependent oxidoreductase [Streptomyces sp. NPDC003015]
MPHPALGGFDSAARGCAQHGAGATPYAMSKAAVERLGRGLRVELAVHGVRVTTAYFAVINTDMTRQGLDEQLLHPGAHQAEGMGGRSGARPCSDSATDFHGPPIRLGPRDAPSPAHPSAPVRVTSWRAGG